MILYVVFEKKVAFAPFSRFKSKKAKTAAVGRGAQNEFSSLRFRDFDRPVGGALGCPVYRRLPRPQERSRAKLLLS